MFEYAVVIIALFGNVCLGLVALFKNPKSASNRLVFLFATVIGIYIFANYLLTQQTSDESAFAYVKQVMSLATLINLTFFLMVRVFPEQKINIRPLLLWISGISTFLLILAAQANLIFTSAKTVVSGSGTPGPAMPLFLIHTLFFVGAGFISLIKKFRKATGIVKMQLRLFLLGAVIMFSAILFLNLISVVIFKITLFVRFLPLYTLIFVSFITYSIVKHRFLDIRFLIARTISYSLLIAVFGILYSLLFALLSSLFISTNLEARTISVSTILALVMAFTFQFVRRIIEKLTDRIFYKEHYDPDKLLYNLTLIMASTLRLEELTHQLLNELLTQMRVTQGAFILTDSDRIYEVAHEGYKESPIFNEQKIIEIMSQQKTLIFDELTESNIKSNMRELNFSLVIVLRTAGEQFGLLALGDKLSGDIFTSEDISVLEILAPEAAVAIKNALAYEEIQRFNITLKDEVKQATTKLTRANIHLKELDHLKDEFVSLASHELRTPMTAIKSYLWLALNKAPTPLDKEVKKNLEVSYHETERLIKLVQNMLTISRIEGKRLELNIEPVNIFDLAKQMFDELKIKADERKIQFTLGSYPEKLIVDGDKEKLIEVIQNIFGNAIKYTPEKGKVNISFSIGQNKVSMHVADTGPGIIKDNLTKLFKKFGRLEEAKKSRTPGTGLGLYISKQIVELHKGTIEVESEVGKGTTFIVKLPLSQSSP